MQLDEISYVESNGNHIQFVLTGQKVVSRLTMSEVEELLPAAPFIRIHRSYIVSKKHISKMDKNRVYIKQTELPVGAAYANEVEKLVK
ncbi:MAG: LytTR family DNA-binding domain-containing protein [Ginsengibacter sp.]